MRHIANPPDPVETDEDTGEPTDVAAVAYTAARWACWQHPLPSEWGVGTGAVDSAVETYCVEDELEAVIRPRRYGGGPTVSGADRAAIVQRVVDVVMQHFHNDCVHTAAAAWVSSLRGSGGRVVGAADLIEARRGWAVSFELADRSRLLIA